MDLLLSLIAKDEASKVFGDFSGVVVGTTKVLGDMSKAAAEAERVEKQLHRVAGELTSTFKSQASAISQQLAVEDELVMSMQTMLLQYGAAPAAVDSTTRAILDYAAATGGNAESATQALIRGVQQGTGSIKALGLQYEVTGDYSKDLEAATAALAKRFNGAAATDAETMGGTSRAAKIAMGDLQESFGGLINDFIAKTEVIKTTAEAFRFLNEAMFGPKENKDQWDKRAELLKEKALIESALKDYTETADLPDAPGVQTRDQVVQRLKEINAEIAKIEASPVARSVGLGLPSAPIAGFENTVKSKGGGGGVTDEQRAAWAAQRDAIMRAQMKGEDEIEAHALELNLKAEKRRQDELEKQRKHTDDWLSATNAQLQTAYDVQDKEQAAHFAKMGKVADDFFMEQQKEFDRATEMWLNAGMQIGNAIINGIVDALKSDGSEGSKTASIIKTIYDIAEMAVGIVFSAMGGGQIWSGFQAGKGALMSMGDAVDKNSNAQYHSGGWPRAHSGMWMPGEVPALLQEGERVLSRSEVARMGGRQGVESRVRGGGGGASYNITAIDAQSFKDYLEGRGGRAMFNAVRTGKGSLASVIGRI